MKKVSRIARVGIASALASVVALGAFGIPGAGADTQSFAASANGFALRVSVDLSGLPAAAKGQIDSAYAQARAALPADAQAKLPATFPYKIDQILSKTSSDASSSLTKAVSSLGEGFATLQSRTATTMGESQNYSEQAVAVPDNNSLKVLDVVGGILKSTVAAGPKVDGSATLAQVGATLAGTASVLPTELKDAFAEVATQVNSTLSTASTQVQSQVNTVESTLIGSLPEPIKSTLPTSVVSDLSSSVQIPTTMPNPLAGNLASITDIVNGTTAQKLADGRSAADANSKIKAVSLLGGLISVSAINLSSHSEAAGTPGSAKNSSACTLADVRMGGTSGVALDGSNVYVNVNGSPVAVPAVGGLVDSLKSQVNTVLNQAGISVKLCDAEAGTAAADGTSATQSRSAFSLTFAPKAPAAISALGINAGDTLAKITIDPTVQTAAQAQAPAPAPVATLPHTGASAKATGIFGLALIGGAFVLRRRFAY
jgi:LPXTG-motif cell wall-anchored protein